ncbi:hypothetical protein A2276_02770 [candidate division WOR-1 bacterium RIFOXYA12_FULL_43_27]|uniref:DUF559 domain-containing protein n=1 Tax=candidate division WOR-1 bacterium RIFOXYC2_FULL_46_14 TaxID=1802587 RepID=A0A1F4U7U1_UNCSA|nr:MAG: hypothetical protein A2276_02770 [candidate division WOR-1 bacterium RIFOXYA12_FULL_43_27]OGC19368.1 MAG: hypothetical protein A2292_01565 [candidate division WOR-1 bacterium RIFOXYB2_FULL_46_45]OGC30357.1 MAG: hypothetical protein A2232_01565 [candidate division WOR-1 bacterium RIFOXYA2_FULL_46_56]OGC40957.1 MAG: hypothetical protein A2438_01565 [candidate division WOR-1 bacterium RIFOXYC2_FULL_46_14]
MDYNLIKYLTRNLRKNPTDSEWILWKELRNRKLLGKKFFRQFPVIYKWNNKKRFFITDFYCSEAQLVIEVDGGIHEKQQDYDEAREYVLKSLGFTIIRFKNKEITTNLKKVLTKISSYLQ